MKANAEQIIRESIAKVQADGWRIAAGKYLNGAEMTCCALGAVIIARGHSGESVSEGLRRVLDLDVSSLEWRIFTSTFDSGQWCGYRNDIAARIRSEFMPTAGGVSQ